VKLEPLLLVIASVAGAIIIVAGGWAPQQPPAPKDLAMTTNTPCAPSAAKYSKAGYDVEPYSAQRIDELAKKLSPKEAEVILAKGTEPAFCGTLVDNHKEGVYTCRLCGLPLFRSDDKFDSGTGWPSFFQPFDKDHIRSITDRSHGMERVEILCARCTAHLGHVFEDGPRPTGLRYCLNSVSLEFVEKGRELPPMSKPVTTETAYFAGGCFWGVEDQFQQLPGVIDAVSGYMGGKTKNPTYQDVCSHSTGHAETVKVTFDPARVSYRKLLEFFFKIHDPTEVDRQGPDIGDNYRSAIFASTPAQLLEVQKFIAERQASPKLKGRRIATQVVGPGASGPFYAAEDYHQDYHAKHGGHCPIPADTGE
jgi:peptide methionine sulfoxide reductase msrA/msrB